MIHSENLFVEAMALVKWESSHLRSSLMASSLWPMEWPVRLYGNEEGVGKGYSMST